VTLLVARGVGLDGRGEVLDGYGDGVVAMSRDTIRHEDSALLVPRADWSNLGDWTSLREFIFEAANGR